MSHPGKFRNCKPCNLSINFPVKFNAIVCSFFFKINRRDYRSVKCFVTRKFLLIRSFHCCWYMGTNGEKGFRRAEIPFAGNVAWHAAFVSRRSNDLDCSTTVSLNRMLGSNAGLWCLGNTRVHGTLDECLECYELLSMNRAAQLCNSMLRSSLNAEDSGRLAAWSGTPPGFSNRESSLPGMIITASRYQDIFLTREENFLRERLLERT